MIEIALLGGVSVTVNGALLSGEAAQRRRVALLALLAAPAVRPVSRDRLIGWLWPDHDPESARHLLSAALHVLRKALGAEALVTTGDDVGLNPALVEVDAAEFREAVAAGEAERALVLYAGDFMEGFFVNDAGDFAQWVDGERAELKRLYGETLEQVAAQRAATGNAAGAAEAWRRRAGVDPYDARVALELMKSLAAAGQRAAAIQHARLHAQLLEQEFGAAADPQVEALAAALRQAPEVVTTKVTLSRPPARSVLIETPIQPSAAPVEASTGPATDTAAGVVAAIRTAPGPKPKRWRRSDRFWWVVGSVAVVAGGLGLVAIVNRPIDIGVRPFTSAEDSLNSIGGTIADDVRTECEARIDGVQLVGSDVSFPTAAIKDSREAIRRMKVDLVLDGQLDSEDGLLNLHLELKDRKGRVVVGGKVSWPVQGPQFTRKVVARLAAGLGRDLRPEPVEPQVDEQLSPEADRHYRLGRNAWLERATATPQSLRDALDNLRLATDMAPRYAPAWAMLANTYNMLGSYDYAGMGPDTAYPRADSAARKALALVDTCWEAEAALANAQANYAWDWKAARSNYLQALEHGGDPWVREWYALTLAALGDNDEALRQSSRAVREQSEAPLTLVNHAHVLYYTGDYLRARKALQEALEIDPTHVRARILGAAIDLVSQQEQRALAMLSEIRARSADSPEPLLIALLGYAQAKTGRREEARVQLGWLRDASTARYVPHELIAVVHLALGEHDTAFAELDRAVAERSSGMMYLKADPLIRPLRSDPHFQVLLRKVGL